MSADPPTAGGSAAQDRMLRLTRLASALADAVTVQQAADAVVKAGGEELQADSVTVCLLGDDGTTYHLVAQGGLSPENTGGWESFPADAPVPVVDAVRTRTLVVVDGVADRERRYPIFGRGPIASETLVSAPLAHGEEAIGALTLGFAERRELGDLDRAFVTAAADLCAIAVHRARLSEYQQRALARQRFLAEASVLLSQALPEVPVLLRQVADLATAEIAESCALCLLEDGVLRPAAAVHRDPARQPVVDALVARQPVITNEGLLEVAATGEAVLVPVIDDEQRLEGAEDEAHLQLVAALGVTSALVVPLRARGHVLGILLLMQTGGGRAFDADDRELASQLANRAALAIDNASLLAERAELVEHLQTALSSHRAIEQAKGILATRWDTDVSTAFDAMRRHARTTRRKIDQVAEDVVAGTDDVPRPPGP
jgi:GAF domain-containing protein